MPDAAPRLATRLLIAGLFLFAWPAFADVVTIPASRDNTLIEDPSGALSNGSGPALFAGRTAQPRNSIRRAIIAFDVAGVIPAGSVVTGARLTLNVSQTIAGPIAVGLHRVEADWGEGDSNSAGGGGAPASPGDATWIHAFYDARLWATQGGDYSDVALESILVDRPGPYTWGTPAMVAAVQSWLDEPKGNHGWLLRALEDAPSTVKRFDSREHADPALRPALTIEYTPPCDPRPTAGPGYWHRQCLAAPGLDGPTEPGFADRILPCADAALKDLDFAEASACDTIAPERPAGCLDRALRELTSMIFNLCAGRVQTSCPAGGGSECASRTLGEVLAEIAARLHRGECPRASTCAAPRAGEAVE